MLFQFDWNVTQNENMADISGLQIAYKTWRLLQEGDARDARLPGINLSPRQLFFLNAAQVNVSGEERNLCCNSHIVNIYSAALLSTFATGSCKNAPVSFTYSICPSTYQLVNNLSDFHGV